MHPSATYEPAACPWCGCSDPLEWCPALHVVDCSRCGLRYASPQLPAAARDALYSQSYFQSTDSGALGYDDYDADRAILLPTFRARVRDLLPVGTPPGRLLDVGCATGVAVEAAQSLGWEAEGIDLSEYAVQLGRERHGLPLYRSEIEQWQSPLAPYDAITMWDYIEHVPDPVATLRAACALLRPGGRLMVTTPDVASLPARWFRERWMGYKQDEHLVYFSRLRLRAFLQEAGFRPVFDHYVGKHIELDFFCARLRDYTPRLSRALAGMLRMLGLGQTVLYINPFDIICVAADRPADVSA